MQTMCLQFKEKKTINKYQFNKKSKASISNEGFLETKKFNPSILNVTR